MAAVVFPPSGVLEAALDGERDSRVALDVLLVLRVLRLARLIGSVQR